MDDAAPPDGCDASRFVTSSLRAARHSKGGARQPILSDVADLIGCRAEDLAFLFRTPTFAANDTDPVIMPDYRAHLHGNAALLVAE